MWCYAINARISRGARNTLSMWRNWQHQIMEGMMDERVMEYDDQCLCDMVYDSIYDYLFERWWYEMVKGE